MIVVFGLHTCFQYDLHGRQLIKKSVFQASITCPKEQVIFVLGDDVLGLQRGYFFI